MDLPAAEITAVTGQDPGEHDRELTARSAHRFTRESTLAGEPTTARF